MWPLAISLCRPQSLGVATYIHAGCPLHNSRGYNYIDDNVNGTSWVVQCTVHTTLHGSPGCHESFTHALSHYSWLPEHFAETSAMQNTAVAGLGRHLPNVSQHGLWALKSNCLFYILALPLSSWVTSDKLFNFSGNTASVSLPVKWDNTSTYPLVLFWGLNAVKI